MNSGSTRCVGVPRHTPSQSLGLTTLPGPGSISSVPRVSVGCQPKVDLDRARVVEELDHVRVVLGGVRQGTICELASSPEAKCVPQRGGWKS